jgi:hypothetical protein
MATEIKRVRFFDGQFLKELEFRDEQAYHQHLRRRMNFFLFGQSGVVQVGADDLRFFDLNNADKTFRVRAGTAICRRPLLAEGKEIVLFVDSPAIDLDTEGIVAGGTAFVTIHYEEEEAKDPPSEGDVDENTRVKEKAILKVHSSLPAGPAPNGEEFVLLGTIPYNDVTNPDYTGRHEAKLRTSLLSGPAAPVVTGLTGITSAAPGGAPVAAVIGGSNLSGATAVTFTDPAVTAVVDSSTAVSVNITVTVAGGAVPGPKAFSVTTPGGTANSPGGVNFNVTGVIPAPTITLIDVHTGAQGATVAAVITGTNLTGASGVAFSGAGITATIQPGGTATTLPISIIIGAAATVGARTFTVTTPGGTATSAGVVGADFTVTAAAPPVTLIPPLVPTLQASNGTVEIHGTNIRNPALAVNTAATGTSVQLRKAAVTVAALNPTVRPDVGGHQVVQVTIPPRPGAWAVNEAVTLDLTFNLSTGSLPFSYDD